MESKVHTAGTLGNHEAPPFQTVDVAPTGAETSTALLSITDGRQARIGSAHAAHIAVPDAAALLGMSGAALSALEHGEKVFANEDDWGRAAEVYTAARGARRVSLDVVMEILAEAQKKNPVGQRTAALYRLGLCKALEIIGSPVSSMENAILVELSDAAKKRAGSR